MERIGMSQQERDWLEWLKRTRDGMLTQKQAAEKMGVTDRWVRELLGRLEERGDAVVVHRLRGQPSNRKIAAEVRAKALKVLTEPDWHDFGPTFASEQLAKRHNIGVSKETVRAWMTSAGLWKSKSRKLEAVHCWRPRRSGFGELVQWDTGSRMMIRISLAGCLLGMTTFAASNSVTFNKDVLPVLQKNCQECHRPREVTPMSYSEASPWAKAMKAAVLAQKMPPWFADPQYGHFANDRRLGTEEIGVLSAGRQRSAGGRRQGQAGAA
jgi:hypothetical protein